MNWDTIKGNWNQLRGRVREEWGELTDDEVEQIGGNKDQLVGKLQERYGIAREEAEERARNFFDRQHGDDNTRNSL